MRTSSHSISSPLSVALAAALVGCSSVGGTNPSPLGEGTTTQSTAAQVLRSSALRLARPASYSESVLYSFHGAPDGAVPYADLIDEAGALYGTTEDGGVSGYGTVFKLTRSGSGYTESVLYNFQAGNDGAFPTASLIEKAGALYGTTGLGGASGAGTVFKLTPSGSGYTESVVYSFQGGSDGAYPSAGVIDEGGALYGTTPGGGGAGDGTVFKLTPSGSGYTESVLYSFQGGSDGASPYAGVTSKAGALYGTTFYGGLGNGTVFKLKRSKRAYTESVLYSFRAGSDGANPYFAGVIDEAGALYGTTYRGGADNSGTVFELTPSGSSYTESVLYSFGSGTDGSAPVGGVVADKSGNLYGTTHLGGQTGNGAVFKLTRSASGYAESILYSFLGAPDGGVPYAGLIDKAGALYGTTHAGGQTGNGTVFKLTP
jgi:uncharacterized repeat protein (TIGR03803 family)